MMTQERTPAEKMAFKSGWTVRTHNAPTDYPSLMCLPNAAQVDNESQSPDILHLFFGSIEELEFQFDSMVDQAPTGIPVWIAFPKPKKNEKNPKINRELVMREVARHGWKAVTGISISDNWSVCRVKPQSG